MTQATAPIQHLTPDDVAAWYQQQDVEMAVGDALDSSTAPVVVGFARYRKGAANQITLPYDEALIVTRGVLTVRRVDGVATAAAGEVIFHRAGATVVYQADEDAELVYVSHPALPVEPVQGFHPARLGLAAQLAPDTPPAEPTPTTTSRCSKPSGGRWSGASPPTSSRSSTTSTTTSCSPPPSESSAASRP